MSFYSDASLVVEPAIYKAGTLFSAKPGDGSGDLTFTRSNDTATRVGPDGLIEKVRTNLLTYSNTFSNAAWQVVGTPTLTANYDTNPLTGANDAWRFQSPSISDRIFQAFSGSFHNFSLYAKGTGTIRLRDSSGTYAFNMVLTSSWQRASLHIPASFGNVQITSDGGCDATIYGAQLETGDIATDYIPTTSAAVSVGPVANVPRLDYLNSSCPRLLLEPQTTALNNFSEQLDDAYWTKANCTVTANQTASPSGYVDAELVLDDTSNNQHVITRSIAVTSGNKYTASFFLKAAGYTTAAIRMGAGSLWTGGTGPTVNFDLVALTGTVVDGSGVTFTIEDYGNGWRRCSVTGTCVTSGNTVFSLYVKQYNAYVGNGTSGIYAWGANITATGYVQSYVPTLGAAVTRGADACSKTSVSSLIGQTEGTLFVEANLSNTTSDVFRGIAELNDGTTANRITLFRNLNGTLRLFVRQSSTTQADISYGTLVTGSVKIAVAYANNDISFYVNGVQVGTDTSATIPACSDLDLGIQENNTDRILGDSISQALLFKTRLTNAQMQELTSL